MAKKPTVTTIASGYYSRNALNTNFEALRDGFDNTLSLDGSTPNAMGADLDMNSNDILNVNDISTSSLRLNGVLVSPADLSTAGSVMYSNKFTGDGSTVAYTLSYDPYIKDNTLVYIDGVYQNKDGYAISGTTLTFSEAPPLNSLVEVVVARTLTDVGTADAAAVTYSQGGTGAVSTTVENKLQEFVSVKDFGAVGDGVTDDTAAFVAALAASDAVYVPEGTYFLSNTSVTALSDKAISIPSFTRLFGAGRYATKITTDVNSDTYADRTLFLVDAADVEINNITFDLAQTFSGGKSGIQKVITATENADNFVADNLVFNNGYSTTYLWVIAVNVGASNYSLTNLEFNSLDVLTDGTEGNLNGSLRGIYIGYDKVGTDPAASLGYGRIENIVGIDLTPYEDTDLVQCISNSGSNPYSHYSPIIIRNVYGKNVGKRLVKTQVNGASIEDVYADATNISHGVGYMFAIVGALNGATTVRNIRGKGYFKTGIEAKDETYIEDVSIESDWTTGTVPSSVNALVLYEGGKSSRGVIKLSNIHTKGSWRQGILIRENGYGDTSKVSIDNFRTDNSQVDYSLGIFAGTQTGNVGYVKISNSVFGTLSNTSPSIAVDSYDGVSAYKVDLVEMDNVLIRGSSTSVVGVDLEANRVNINNIVDETDVQNIIQVVAPSGGVLNGIKDYSGSAIAKRLANIASCNTMRVTNGYSPTSTTNAYRVNGGNNIHFSQNITANGITLVTAVGGATNVVTATDNYTFA